MTIRPSDYPAMPVELFAGRNDWVMHSGDGMPPDMESRYCLVMYSNGFVANRVRIGKAWETWSGSRNWWLKPDDDRLYIMCYIPL